MCGLMGLIEPADSGFTYDHVQAFKINLYVNALRGQDSTGVVGINKKGLTGVIKEVGNSAHMMTENPKWDKFQDSLFKEGKIAFGHGRAATRGDVTLANAHPFIIDNGLKGKDRHFIILAHNGTLHQGQRLPGFHEFDVDSAWLAQKIFDLGPEEALSQISGAIAAIWWDSKEKALFIYRKDERPLHFIQHKDAMHINSEGSALMFVKYKQNLQYEWSDLRQFKSKVLYRFDIKDPTKFTEKPIKLWWESGNNWGNVRRIGSRNGGVNQHELDRLSHYSGHTPLPLVPLFGPVSDFEKLVNMMLDGRVTQIAFLNGKKFITYSSRSVEESSGEPFEDGMTLITKITDEHHREKLKFNYLNGQNQATYRLLDKVDWNRCIAGYNSRHRKALASDLSVDASPMPGKKVHFHTKVGADTIRHTGLMEQRVRPGFEIYSNSVDGTFVLGKKILFEAYGAIDGPHSGAHHMKYNGMLMKPAPKGPSPEIEISWWDQQRTKDEVFKVEKFVGTLQNMRVQTNAEAEVNQTNIAFHVVNVSPAETLTKEEIAEIYQSQEMTYDEALIEFKAKTKVIYGPANEE